MTLASTISMLSAQPKLDDRGSEILAAATSLQESTGRSLLPTLRAMCASWGVQRREKIAGKWKDRSVVTLHELLNNSVCLAASQYLAASQENVDSDGAAEHLAAVAEDNATQGPAKKPKTVLSWAQLADRAVALPETAEDVMELRRLSLDLFEARKRSGEVCVGDIAVLQTLPQGVARLATLQMQEHMRARKTKNSVGASSSGNISLEPAVKKPRALQEHFGRESIGAAEHVDGTAAAASTALEEPSCAIRAATAIAQDGVWLFQDHVGHDHGLIEWLRAQEAQPRCNSLLKQVLA